MLNVKNLAKRYGDRQAVGGITFSARAGEIVGFLGPNGAGKTTTLRMLSTYLAPSSGTAEIAGHDICKESDAVRRKIGYLPEDPPLYRELTVREYLKFVGEIRGISRRELAASVDRVIESCVLTEVAARPCRHLSRGFRQRVGLAQAIIHSPQVIILDEPTSGLDPQQIIEIRALIRSLAAQRTVILSTHILPEVSTLCSKVVIINSGRIALEAPLADLPAGRSLEEIFVECASREAGWEAARGAAHAQ